MTQFASSESKATHKTSDEKFCADCGLVIKKMAEICPHCGVRQMSPPLQMNDIFHTKTANGKNKNMAVLLAFISCLFFGIGVHQFYLGRISKGLLYFLFCWTVIPLILSIIDVVLLLTMNNATFNQKYGHPH